jgi:hypothetical protein
LNRPIDYLLHAFTLARGQRFTLEREIFSEKVRLVVLPSPWLDFYVPFASLEHTPKLIEMAYEETKKFLDAGSDIEETPASDPPASVTPLN